MTELEPIRVSYLKELAITAVPIRIANKYLLNNKILQTNKDTIHYRTFIWLYKCFFFIFQSRQLLMDKIGELCLVRRVSFSIMSLLKSVLIILLLVVMDLGHSIPSSLSSSNASLSKMFHSSPATRSVSN